jgi:gamma-glutamylputrescine oxidase
MTTVVEHAPTWYAATANPAPERPPLDAEIEADVCVIGAGFSGLSAALYLAERGYGVVALEAARVGWGASGRNGGQIVNGYSRDLDAIERTYGRDSADALGRMAFEGARIIRERIERYGIDCQLKDGGFFAAFNAKQMRELAHLKGVWESHGHGALELYEGRERLHEIVVTDRYAGGLLDRTGGHLHPLNLALGEAAALESLGGRIFEQSAVLRIEQGAPSRVHTARGVVRARFIVVAGNAYLGNLVPELAAKSMPCGTQVIATEPLGEARARELIPSGYCVEDHNFILDYYRITHDTRLLYGGGVSYGGGSPASIEAFVRRKMLKTFPSLEAVRVDFAWTGNFLLTLSRIPQLGRIGENIYYLQGYSGHGVTTTHLAGRLIAEALSGEAERFDVFARLPHYRFPGGRVLRVPLTAMGAWWYSLRDLLGL